MRTTDQTHSRPPVFVTGGAGFIGSTLVHALVAGGERVVNVDRLSYAGRLANLDGVLDDERHTFVHADCGDGEAMRALLTQHRPALIYHLAAESHVDRSIDTPIGFMHANTLATASLLDEVRHYWQGLTGSARDDFRFVQVSTDEVFGSLAADDAMFSESSPMRPNSPYAASKAGADAWASAYHHTYGLPVITTHCGNNFGPRQLPEKLIPLIVMRALDGLGLPVYGNGENIRDWIHVDDHVSALMFLAGHGVPGERYLIGARDEWRNIDLVNAICATLDEMFPGSAKCPHQGLIEMVADRPGHDFRYANDPAKIEALGWRAKRSLRDDLKGTIAWYLDRRQYGDGDTEAHHLRRLGLAAKKSGA
jgi:dTDP-glucose 4,6-dehydratase